MTYTDEIISDFDNGHFRRAVYKRTYYRPFYAFNRNKWLAEVTAMCDGYCLGWGDAKCKTASFVCEKVVTTWITEEELVEYSQKDIDYLRKEIKPHEDFTGLLWFCPICDTLLYSKEKLMLKPKSCPCCGQPIKWGK